jgi:formylglycine-generating enzyme required for sulfatase activity
MNWHYSKNGQTRGPADSAALGRLIQSGDLGSNDLVWREGWAEWRVLGQVEGLADYLQSSRPATPPPIPGSAPGSVAPAIQARTFAGIKFIWCPPGSFLMGTPGNTLNEIPHQVTLTRGFWIGKYPVTQGQWMSVMRDREPFRDSVKFLGKVFRDFAIKQTYDPPAGGDAFLERGWFGRKPRPHPDLPVQQVSWHDAQRWPAKRSQ